MMATMEIEGQFGGTVRFMVNTDEQAGRVWIQTKADGDRAAWGPQILVDASEIRVAVSGALYTDRAERRRLAPDHGAPAGAELLEAAEDAAHRLELLGYPDNANRLRELVKSTRDGEE